MILAHFFTRRSDGRMAPPADRDAIAADLEARLVKRKAKRPARSEAACKGWNTRRAH